MSAAQNILVVDDDAGITALLCGYLTRYGFAAHAASDGASMHERLAAERTDLIVLDLQLPGPDGLALAQQLRRTSRIPIIMLTARGEAWDRVIGLEMGADDYMSKPFEPRELVARIQTVLRRVASPRSDGVPAGVADDVIHFDGWKLHRHERRLTSPAGLVVPLSNAEYRLLCAFLKTPRRVCTRESLMSEARGRDLEATDRSIDLLVSRLRHKLCDDADGSALIKTARGAGYVFNAQSVQGCASWQH